MEKEKTDEVFAKITLHFVESIPSNSFNGIAANRLAGPRIKSSDIKPILKHLVESGSITCTFSNYDGNIHIIRMLGQWLFSIYNFDDPRVAQEIIIDPLREIRRLRQKPAHTTTDDQYDPTFYGARGKLLYRVYNSLISILEMLEKHSQGFKIDLPEQVRTGKLDRW